MIPALHIGQHYLCIEVFVVVVLVRTRVRLTVNPGSLLSGIDQLSLDFGRLTSFPLRQSPRSEHALCTPGMIATDIASISPRAGRGKHHLWVLRVKVILGSCFPVDALYPSEVLIMHDILLHHLC